MALGDTPRVMRPFGFRAAATLGEAPRSQPPPSKPRLTRWRQNMPEDVRVPRFPQSIAHPGRNGQCTGRVARIWHETTAHPSGTLEATNGGGSFLARRLWNPEDQVSPPRIPKLKQVRPTGGPGRNGVRDVASRNACQRSARRSVATPRHAHASSSGREKTKSGGVDELSRCVSNRHRCFSAVKPSLQQFPPQSPDPAQPSPASFAFEFSQFLMNPVMATPEEKSSTPRNAALRQIEDHPQSPRCSDTCG